MSKECPAADGPGRQGYAKGGVRAIISPWRQQVVTSPIFASGGGTDGSRWSERSERPPVSRSRVGYPTAAAVAEETHAIWYLIRDPCRGRVLRSSLSTGGRSLRSDHRLPYVTPPASGTLAEPKWKADLSAIVEARSCVLQRLTNILIVEIGIRTLQRVTSTECRHRKQHTFDRDPHAADARLPVHLARLNGDSIQRSHRAIVRAHAIYFKYSPLDPPRLASLRLSATSA